MPQEDFAALFVAAQEAGRFAAVVHEPTPMMVVEHIDPFDASSPIVKQYPPEIDGACGFAWVNVKPGNSAFANWLKKNGLARRDSYYGGVSIWISDYQQSYEKKMAHAAAMAGVLSAAGFKAYASGRLD